MKVKTSKGVTIEMIKAIAVFLKTLEISRGIFVTLIKDKIFHFNGEREEHSFPSECVSLYTYLRVQVKQKQGLTLYRLSGHLGPCYHDR